MKKLSTIFLASLLYFSIYAQAAVPLDKVVAVVNNSVVTQNQLNQTIEIISDQLKATGEPIPAPAVLRKKALEQVIGEVLQLQVAQRVGIVATDADVNRAIEGIAKQNNFTVEQLKTALEQQGINYKTYRKQLQDQIVLHQVEQQALGGKINVTEADINAVLKKAPAPDPNQARYHVDDLLIPLSETATPEQVATATEEANELLKKAQSGASFEQLGQNSVQHIDLQWRRLQDFPEVFANVVPTLKVGSVTGPIKAPNGLHLLRLLAVEGQTKSMTREQAKQIAFQKKLQQETEKWVQQLRKTAYVKIM